MYVKPKRRRLVSTRKSFNNLINWLLNLRERRVPTRHKSLLESMEDHHRKKQLVC
jgi:hypothetical protein